MSQQRKIAVLGLGYVGLTVANAFGQKTEVIGYDTNSGRIAELKKTDDNNKEITSNELARAQILYTTDPNDLKSANFFIITVPSPLDKSKQPDMSMLKETTKILGKYLKQDDIVIYESTVYPGATEEELIPILEQESKLKCIKDFGVAYSPERVNPGDKQHTFTKVIKIVSATDPKTQTIVCDVYSSIISAGVYLVSKLKIAEATKIIENIQRDINIAYLNEAAMILHSLGIELTEVLKAMKTKWNALDFKPGLVGGHCIGVNSHYLTYRSQIAGFNPEMIMAARNVNEEMPEFLIKELLKQLILSDVKINKCTIGILGLTYKENCPDLKDTVVIDIINCLKEYGIEVLVHDPIADPKQAQKLDNIKLINWDKLQNLDGIIVAVAHNQYLSIESELITKIKKNGVIMDVKGILDPNQFTNSGIKLWQI